MDGKNGRKWQNILATLWYDNDMGGDTIRFFKDIPTTLYMLKKYFQGKIYTDIKISHSKMVHEIQVDLSWWLKKEKYCT